jgi:hypothetical protein
MGHFVYKKSFYVVIDAFNPIIEKGISAGPVIGGTGGMTERLKKTNRLKLPGSRRIPLTVPHESGPRPYNNLAPDLWGTVNRP